MLLATGLKDGTEQNHPLKRATLAHRTEHFLTNLIKMDRGLSSFILYSFPFIFELSNIICVVRWSLVFGSG